MWLPLFGYSLSYGLVRCVIGNSEDQMIRRRFSTWLILATLCISHFGSCNAQKDSGAFNDGVKGDNRAFQSSQKGSELGESPSRNVAPGAGRQIGNVRAVQSQPAASGGDDSGPPPPSSPNTNLSPSRPSLGAAGGGLSPIGSAGNPLGGDSSSADHVPVAQAPDQIGAHQADPTAVPNPEEPADGPPRPQLTSGQTQPLAQLPPPRGKSPRPGKARGGANANFGQETTILATTANSGLVEIADAEATTQAPDLAPTTSAVVIGNGRPNKGKGPKARPANAGGSNARLYPNINEAPGIESGPGSGDGPIKIGAPIGGLSETSSATVKPILAGGLVTTGGVREDESETTHAAATAIPRRSPRPKVGAIVTPSPVVEEAETEPPSQAPLPVLQNVTRKPKRPVVATPINNEEGGEVTESPETSITHGPIGAKPNVPVFPAANATFANTHIPNEDGLKTVAASGPQLGPRSPGAPSQHPLGQPHQSPLEAVPKATTVAPVGGAGAASGAQSAENEDVASSALIKAVNDEYVDVVKNLTDAGVLTEADYESKPVSDLFAILLEKLINANPGANEEEQHRLVHQAGIEFVEVFKANAANTKNVSEIVRQVTEQLQSAPLLLNEGRGEPGQQGGTIPSEATSPPVNPADATAVHFGSPGRTSVKNAPISQISTEGTPNFNVSHIANHSGLPITVIGGQAPGISPLGTTHRPAIQPFGETELPGPPASEGEQSQRGSTVSPALEISTDRLSTKHNTGLGGLGSGPLSGASSPSPVPPAGFHAAPNTSRVGGFSTINGHFTPQEFNATSSASAENNSSESSEVVSTTEPTQEGAAVPIAGQRFPFPAHAPSTLRPPLRFFTTSTVATTEDESSESSHQTGLSHQSSGSETLSPFVVTAAPPSFAPFPRNPSPSSSDGRVVIGATHSGVDSSSETSATNISDFPLPPTWPTSDTTPGGIVIGGSSTNTGSSTGTIELNEGPNVATGRVANVSKASTTNPLSGSSSSSSESSSRGGSSSIGTEFGSSPANGSLPTSDQFNVTLLPIVTTTSDEVEPPFTHDVHDVFGGNIVTSTTSALFPISVVGANGTNTRLQPVNASTTSGATHVNTTGGDFLVFGSGLESASNVATSKPWSVNTTDGAAFVTESAEVNETSGEIHPSAEATIPPPVFVSGVESGIRIANISNNGTNVTSTPIAFPPGQIIPGATIEPLSGISGGSTGSPFEGSLSTTTESSAEINETSPANNASSPSGVLVIGTGTDNHTGVIIGSDSTRSGTPISSTPSSSSFSSTPGIFGSTLGNETTGSVSSSGGLGISTPGVSGATTEEIESGSGSAENVTDIGSSSSGGGGGISLPTKPVQQNTTDVPGSSEGESSTPSTSGTGSTSSNPMIPWSFRITDPQTPWDNELLDKTSFQYKDLHSALITDLKTLFKTLEPTRFVDVSIKRFSKGSVVVDGQTELTERVDSQQLVENFVKLVGEHKNTIGGRAVDPSSINFDSKRQSAPQAGSNAVSSGGTPNWVIALVVAVILLALIIIAAVVVIRRKRQNSRDNYMVDEETMNGGAKAWQPRNGNAQTQGQQRGGAANGRDQYSGVNMYEMKEPVAPNAHSNYGYQPDRPSNGHGANGRSVTEIHINETNMDNEASSKH